MEDPSNKRWGIHFQNVHSRAVGTFNMPDSIMFVYKPSRELEGISEDSEDTKFDVPFLLIRFKNGIQVRVLNLCVKGSYERNRKWDFTFTNRLTNKNKREWCKILKFSAICDMTSCETSVIKGQCIFRFCLLKRIWGFNSENAKSRYKYIIIKWLYESGYLRRDEGSNIALNSIPLLGRIIFLSKQS